MSRSPRSGRKRRGPSRRALTNNTPRAVTGYRWLCAFPIVWGESPDPTTLGVAMDVTGGTIRDTSGLEALMEWRLTIVNNSGGYTTHLATAITNNSEDDTVKLVISFDVAGVEVGWSAFLIYQPNGDNITGPNGGGCLGIAGQQLPDTLPGAIVAGYSDQF